MDDLSSDLIGLTERGIGFTFFRQESRESSGGKAVMGVIDEIINNDIKINNNSFSLSD